MSSNKSRNQSSAPPTPPTPPETTEDAAGNSPLAGAGDLPPQDPPPQAPCDGLTSEQFDARAASGIEAKGLSFQQPSPEELTQLLLRGSRIAAISIVSDATEMNAHERLDMLPKVAAAIYKLMELDGAVYSAEHTFDRAMGLCQNDLHAALNLLPKIRLFEETGSTERADDGYEL